MRILAAVLWLLPQALWAQVKADLSGPAQELPGTPAAGGSQSQAGVGAAVKLSAPSLVAPIKAPLGGAPKVRAEAKAGPVPALPSSALSGPSRPSEEGRGSRRPTEEPPYFAKALVQFGMPADLAGWLADYQKTRHPGDQDSIYHGLKHSRDVPNAAARVLEGPGAAALSPRQRIMLIVAAALHDIDPERATGTPARVSATLPYLDTDPESRALLAEVQRLYGITTAQVKALIMATDFDMDPVRQAKLLADFDDAAARAFPAEEAAWAREWGRRLAFVDKVASYLGSVQDSEKIVRGLAHELKAPEEALLAGSYVFQRAQRQSPEYALLPADLRANFERSLEHFRRLGESLGVSSPVNEQARAQAPPATALEELERAAAGGGSFKDQTVQVVSRIKSAKYTLGQDASKIISAQQRYKTNLLEGSARVLKQNGLSAAQVASHGTTLRGLWGMLMSGGIEATSSYSGFSGESAEVWAGPGIEGGASYGAKRGVAKALPGVSIILYSRNNPLKIVGGETLNRRPTPKDDFLAAVVTDGEKTLVLDHAALSSLAASAEQWKKDSVAKAHAGRMGDFEEWDRLRDFFDPTRRPP